MNILMITKYPPIQGGVSRDCYWLARLLAEGGHNVHVVTNSFEVEEEYRIGLTDDDRSLMEGEFGSGSIRLHSTYNDVRHVYIPQGNPIVSKMMGIALRTVEEVQPDLIYAHYLEPYGVVAMFLSLMTGIPYIIKHAGSDVGRLMQTEQPLSLYKEVFRRSSLVLSSPSMFGPLLSIGVHPYKMHATNLSYLHPGHFYPDNEHNENRDRMILGVYGKTSPAKGTIPLLRAVAEMSKYGQPVELHAHWGGTYTPKVLSTIDKLGIANSVRYQPFIPHWRIPNFIRSCDVLLFLEHRFSIKIHMPNIPLEVLACGKPLVTTQEIARKVKYRSLVNGENCVIVENPGNVQELTQAIISLMDPDNRREISLNAGSTIDIARRYEAAKQAVEVVLYKALEG